MEQRSIWRGRRVTGGETYLELGQGKWLMLMEYQKAVADEDEWRELG